MFMVFVKYQTQYTEGVLRHYYGEVDYLIKKYPAWMLSENSEPLLDGQIN